MVVGGRKHLNAVTLHPNPELKVKIKIKIKLIVHNSDITPPLRFLLWRN